MKRSARVFVLFSIAALAAILSGCATTTTPTPKPTPVTIKFTSQADGQSITGSRAITVQGTLSGGTVTSFTADLNGSPVAGATHTATSFSIPVTLIDNANTVTVTVDSSGTTSKATLHLSYPFMALATNQDASVVIGQPDFTTTTVVAPSDGTHLGPYLYGDATLGGNVLYLPDYENNRVLGFNSVPTTNGAAADFVLGQPDFTSNAVGTGAAGLTYPESVSAGSGKLAIVSPQHNRVMLFNQLPTADATPADVVVGQTSFTNTAPACSASGLNYPESGILVGTKLIVADSANNRILIWNQVPTTNGAPADIVLGQGTMSSCAPNGGTALGNDTLHYPTDVWTDGTRLVVADEGNNRVLIWNTFPTTNQAPADEVLGQADFTHASANQGSGPSAASLNVPYYVTSNGNQLFVADYGNNRVMVWNSFPASSVNGAPADAVLGQVDFAHGAANQGGSAGANTLSSPSGLAALPTGLLVADGGNVRDLIFAP